MGVQHRPRPGNRIIFRRPNVADVVLAEVKHLDHDAVVLHDGHLRLTRSASGTCTLTRVGADDDDDDDDDGAHTSPRITSEDLHELFQRRHALQEDVVESERRIAELQRSERDEEERRARQLAEHTKSVDVAAHDQRIAAALVTTCEAEAWSNFEVWAEKHEQSRAARILDGVRRLAGWAAEVSSCTTTTTSSSSSSLATTSPSLALLLPHAQLHHLTSAVPWAEMEEDVAWTSLQTLKEEELVHEMPEPANTLRVGLAVLRWLQSTLRGLAAHHRHERLVGRLRGAPLLPHVMADEVLEHREFLEMAMEELRELDGLAEEVVAQHKARRASDDRMMCNDVLAILPAKLLSDADWMQLSSASKSSSSSSFMHEMATLLWDHLLQMKLVETPKSAHVVVGSAQNGSVRIPALALPTHNNNNNNNSTDVLASKLQKLHATPRLRTPRAGISTGNPSTTVPDHAELVLLREELATCLSELQRVHDERDRLLLERRVRRHVRHTTTTTEPPSRSTSYSPGRPSGIVEELEEQLSVAHQRIVEMERRGEAAALLLSNNNNNNNSISARRQDVQEQLRRDLREVQARMTSAEERLSSVLSDQRQCAEDVAQQSAALISAQERLVAMERQLHRQRATTEMLRAKLARKHTNNSGGDDGATMDAMSGVQQNTSSPTTSACEVQPLTLPELRREVLRLRPAVELARSDEEALRMDLRCDGDCYDQERQILRAISEKSRVIITILAERLNEVQQADAARPRFPQVDDAGGT